MLTFNDLPPGVVTVNTNDFCSIVKFCGIVTSIDQANFAIYPGSFAIAASFVATAPFTVYAVGMLRFGFVVANLSFAALDSPETIIFVVAAETLYDVVPDTNSARAAWLIVACFVTVGVVFVCTVAIVLRMPLPV